MLAFRLARHLKWHRWMNTRPRHGDTGYRGVLCIIITLAYILYSFWLLINNNNNNNKSIETNLLIHKAVIKPIWSYETELWGWASKSNRVIMHRSQSKILRATTNALRYVTNHTLHTDFNVPYVSDVIHERINKHHNKPEAHPNPILQPLLQPVNTRRLNRCWPLDLQAPEFTSLDEYPTAS